MHRWSQVLAVCLWAGMITCSSALHPQQAPQASLRASSRRDVGAAFVGALLSGGVGAAVADDAAEAAEAKAAAEKARQEQLKAKIAASKTKYRKADSLYEQRKQVDYSCVSKTGSPCPEGPDPSGQLEDL